RRPVRAAGNGARRHRGPGRKTRARVTLAQRPAALPWRAHRAAASGMTELDARHCAKILQEIGDAAIAADMLVGIHAGAMVGATAARLDRGLLAEDEAGAADGKLPEVHEMPVGQVAVDGKVLRHRA